MPFCNKDLSGEVIKTLLKQVRNNCLKGQWAFDQSKMIGDELDMIVVRYESGRGWIPPIKSYKVLSDLLTLAQKTPPAPDDTQGILNEITNLAQTWAYIWFIPVNVPEYKSSKFLPERTLCGTAIKSRSLDGTKTPGFWEFRDDVLRKDLDLSRVIATPRFGVTHQNPGGGDCNGLIWNYREAANEKEQALINDVEEWLTGLIEKGEAEKVLHLPSGTCDQFHIVPDDEIRYFNDDQVQELTHSLVFDKGFGQGALPADALGESLAALPAAIDVKATSNGTKEKVITAV